MSNSYRRNHFIPKFYLKNFTFDGSHLYVLDKETIGTNRLSVKEKSPKQICYERDRYTLFNKEGKHSPVLEESCYGLYDRTHSATIEYLTSIDFSKLAWSVETQANLHMFLRLLFLRSPISDDLFRTILESMKSMEELGIGLWNSIANEWVTDSEMHRKVFEDANMRKALRPLLAHHSIMATKPSSKHDDLEWRIVRRETKQGKNLAGDTPIIFKSVPNSMDEFRGALVIPISSERSLIRIREDYDGYYHKELLQDLTILHQSKRFVVSSDEDYLHFVLNKYLEIQKSESSGSLTDFIFDRYG